uniref:Putative secreted peptide n=1 Tax=Anopheles braziliensis TaxID=58242 RepID=A0A2M3ZWU5_9DIPT
MALPTVEAVVVVMAILLLPQVAVLILSRVVSTQRNGMADPVSPQRNHSVILLLTIDRQATPTVYRRVKTPPHTFLLLYTNQRLNRRQHAT